MENNLTGPEFIRLMNNFYNSKDLNADYSRMVLDADLVNYINAHQGELKKNYKVAFCSVCLNPHYWQFAKPMIDGAKKFLLPGHKVDFFLWSDMAVDKDIEKEITESHFANYPNPTPEETAKINIWIKNAIEQTKESLKIIPEITIFPIEPATWPMPTLMRYHLMLQQEEVLKDYDYIFYCDIDMMFVNVVGDEILGQDLTAVLQPMYATRKEFWPPYEPNPKSAAYIKRPGQVINDNGRARFMPMYFAGGFQGGKTDKWLVAMKEMRKMIDADFNHNYTPIWNDETVFNKYCFDNPPTVVLTPSYVYPDGLIKEHFLPLWGRDYQPKIVTLTKKFSLSPAGALDVQKTMQELKPLQ